MNNQLHPELEACLSQLREERRFACRSYIEAKAELLNSYCARTGIQACLVPVSGGIDSSVTLGLVRLAATRVHSPIQRTVALSIPALATEGASNQEVATARGAEVAMAFGAEHVVFDLSATAQLLRCGVEKVAQHSGSPWAAGQLVSYLRTPSYYYLATLLSDQGFRCAVVGTTNRDEGAYIGFFGKASDGMVDIQLISDAHKSEVQAVAEILAVPASIRGADPTGDVFDGRTHRQMIEAPYAAIELFQLLRTLRTDVERAAIMRSWGEVARCQYRQYEANLEKLHAQNIHKYLGGNPSVHLDVYPRAVPGGWREETRVMAPIRGGERALTNEIPLPAEILATLEQNESVSPCAHTLLLGSDQIQRIEQILSVEEARTIRESLLPSVSLPVGIDGRRSSRPLKQQETGSHRATVYSEPLAELLWKRVRSFVEPVRLCDRFTAADADGYPVWRAVGVNPALRLICYRQGGSLIPHYDAAYDFGDGRRRTLMTLIIYLSEGDPEKGGRTRFLHDSQRSLPAAERDFSDWRRSSQPEELALAIQPSVGQGLLFDHRLLHDVEPWHGQSDRLILRTDIVFERCGLQPTAIPAELPSEAFGTRGRSSALEADPFYRSAAQLLTPKELLEAGWLELDQAQALAPEQSWFLTTPLHLIQRRRCEQKVAERRPLVLMASGAFCPVHEGHVEMMEKAKQALEAEGEVVLGGYLSPSHDDYVQRKCGGSAISAGERVRLCQAAVAGSSWLHVDPWEALYQPGQLNFSTVILRLERYLNRHLTSHQPIEVVFVFGGDQAEFALAFAGKGRCVCVQRRGWESTFARVAQHCKVQGNSRICMVTETPRVLSSRDLRRMPPSTALATGVAPATPLELTIRDEGVWLTEPWEAWVPNSVLSLALERFRCGVARAFECASERTKVQMVSVLSQQQASQQHVRSAPTLSLDPCIAGDWNLGVSRRFSFGITERLPGLVARPSWPAIEEQLDALPEGDYILVDDDQATGYTTKSVLQLLPARCRVVSVEHLAKTTACLQAAGQRLGVISDTVDLRDFLLGSRDGGLVIELPDGSVARAPYLAPYVQLSDRASVPIECEIGLSRKLWELNREFFSTLGSVLMVCHTSKAFQRLAQAVGFSSTTPLVEICEWHGGQLGMAQPLRALGVPTEGEKRYEVQR